MATVPTPYVAVAGSKASAAAFNAGVQAAFNFLLNRPRCSVYNSVNQSTGSSPTLNVMGFDSETEDTDNMHSTVSNQSRITFNTTGRFDITAFVALATAVTSVAVYTVQIRLNGSTTIRTNRFGNASGVSGQVIVELSRLFTSGDYIEVLVTTTGGVTTETGAGQYGTGVQAVWSGTT